MKTKYLNILKIFVFVVICFVSLGYAAFGSELSISNIVADIRNQVTLPTKFCFESYFS